MEVLKFILLVIAAIIVCGLMAIGFIRLISWKFEVKYELPKDTIWYIEENLIELHSYYESEGDKEGLRKVDEIYKQVQGLKEKTL